MRDVAVHTSQREYRVRVGEGALARIGAAVWSVSPHGRALLCSDDNVAPLYADGVRQSLSEVGYNVTSVVVPAGERQKTLATVQRLYDEFYDAGVRRTDVVVALGGGVIGDMVGFAAATYLRGVRLAQVPTTLLAQVDASVGGKVGVDYRDGKNYIGTFYQPLLVLADPLVLATLPPREVRNGLAEVIKYGLLVGGDLWARVQGAARTGQLSGDLIADCVAVKADIVARDEREETGERHLLNLGHTVGHGIEAAGGFHEWSHGEAVALGLRAALWLSVRLAGLASEQAEQANATLSAVGLPERFPRAAADRALELVGRDKKAGHSGVEYVLLRALGQPVRGVHVSAALLEEVVAWLTSE